MSLTGFNRQRRVAASKATEKQPAATKPAEAKEPAAATPAPAKPKAKKAAKK